MKLSRKLIPAMIMLLVSAVLMSTASFAWFSTNTSATANGMEVKISAANTLLIREYKAENPDAFTTGIIFADTANKTNMSPVSAVAEPNPTFWMVDPDDSENGIEPNDEAFSATKTKFIEDSTMANVLFKTVEIRAQGDEGTAGNLGKITLTVAADDNATSDINKSLRVLVVVDDKSAFLYNPMQGTAVQPIANYTETPTQGTTEKITLGELSEFTNALTADIITGVRSEQTYTVDIYVWFEGQDPSCFANNAINLKEIDIDLTFNLETGTGA